MKKAVIIIVCTIFVLCGGVAATYFISDWDMFGARTHIDNLIDKIGGDEDKAVVGSSAGDKVSETGSSESTGNGAATGTGSETGSSESTGSATATGTGSETGSSENIGSEAATGTGSETGNSENTGSATATGTGSETGSSENTGSAAATGTGSETGNSEAAGNGAAASGSTIPGMESFEMDTDMAALAMQYMMAMAEAEPVETLDLPIDSSTLSLDLARQALTLCTGHSQQGQANIFMNSGFTVVLQDGYDKDPSDESDTCAYTVAKKQIDFYGQSRTLIFVAIRGTNSGEWFSNFDFADSHSDDTQFAENFLMSAQAINLRLIPILTANKDAIVVVAGHSRGAAAANLLGMTLDDLHGSENVYVYTYATPNTYRGSEKDTGYGNIFNFLNPCDVVTEVPLKSMGYHHIGTDLTLPNDPANIARVAEAMQIMSKSCTTVTQYYTERHSLTHAGLDENGLTAYEIMQALASSMTGIRSETNGGLNMDDIYEIMKSSDKSSESDYAPLISQIEKIIGRDGSFGTSIFAQHLPATYGSLIDAYEQYAMMAPGGFVGEIPEGFTGELPEGYAGGLPEGFTGELPEGFAGGLPEGFTGEIPEGFAGGLPEGFTGELPEGYEGGLPEGFAGELPEGYEGGLPEGFTNELPANNQQ